MTFLRVAILCCLLLVALPLTSSIPARAEILPNDITSLIEDPLDSSPLGTRIPLILVHGIHGTESIGSPNWQYWQTFRSFFYSWDNTGLKNKYKIYGMFYESDKLPIDGEGGAGGISEGFRNWLDLRTSQTAGSEHWIDDVPFVILAHSMGGLVSRSFMTQVLHEGESAGKLAGNRVLKLITMATPHHGSPAANNCCRDLLATNLDWLTVFESVDVLYWRGMHGVKASTEPNRSDLRWDNFDSTMSPVGYDLLCANSDNNYWLKALNSFVSYDEKIIAYAGYVDPNDFFRAEILKGGPSLVLGCLVAGADEREKAICASISLDEGLMGLYGNNDGMVPYISAKFQGHQIETRETFVGFDHGQMKGDGLYPGNSKYDQLFDSLAQDLKSTYDEFHLGISAPDYVTILDPVTVTATGKVDGAEPYSWEWDFAYDGSFNAEASGQTVTIPAERYKYDSGNTKTIAVRPNGDDSKIVTKTIHIRPYPLGISTPEGPNSLHRHFQPPGSNLVEDENFYWDYGDGSPIEIGRTQGHTFPTSNYYHVTLTLKLKDESTITSDEWVCVGPGNTVYVPGHTIYGDETWYAGATYIIQGPINVALGATLTVQPGVEVRLGTFTSWYRLYGVPINVYGKLDAEGAHFTWAEEQSAWGAIMFSGAAASQSRLDSCVIEHASGVLWCEELGYCAPFATIYINDSSPTINNCSIINGNSNTAILIKNGSPYISNNIISGFSNGIFLLDSTPNVNGNTLANNQNGILSGYGYGCGACLGPWCGIICNSGPSGGIYTDNTLIGNSTGISFDSYNYVMIAGNHYSNNSDADLYLDGIKSDSINEPEAMVYKIGYMYIDNGRSFAFPKGSTVKLTGSINVSGTLVAKGIDFTSADAKYGGWISFEGGDSSNSQLENCVIEDRTTLQIADSSPTITGCTIRNGSGITLSKSSSLISSNMITDAFIGISIGLGSNEITGPTVTDNTIKKNEYGILISDYRETINAGKGLGSYNNNTIMDNTRYGLYYSHSHGGEKILLEAINNDWGSPSGPQDDSDDRQSGGLYNPSGSGNKVSDHVNYYPWVGSTIGTTVTPTGLIGTVGYSSVNLAWNANSEIWLGGYKIYFTMSPDDPTSWYPLVIGNVATHELRADWYGPSYYFAISSMNTVGVESEKSPVLEVKSGSISGTVLGLQSVGLANVNVKIYDSNGEYVTGSYSGFDGSYIRYGLPTGSYKVSFSPYLNSGYLSEWYDNKVTENLSDPVIVTAPYCTSGIDAVLGQEGIISLTSPNGSETWQAGSTHVIKWAFAGNPGSLVKIQLLNEGILVNEIAPSTYIGSNGSGSYPWTIPAGQVEGNSYQIRITSTTDSSINDTSDGNFTISPPSGSITLTSPNGGEVWQAGSTHNITWNYTGTPGSLVRIELLKDSSVIASIAQSTPVGSSGSGSFPWTIPAGQAVGSTYRLKITSATDGIITDTSNGNFTISAPPGSITLTSPNGGEAWPAMSMQRIQWTYAGTPGDKVKISLLKAGKLIQTISSATSLGKDGKGSFNWYIPSMVAPGDDYKIKIVSTTRSSCNDVSNNVFTIKPWQPVTVFAPNGGENWKVGSVHNITWKCNIDTCPTFKIELLKGDSVSKIIAAAADYGGSSVASISWTVPKGLAYGGEYRIRVTSNMNASQTDTSDQAFTISGPTLDITSPDGGESCPKGSNQTITWTYTGNPGGKVKIQLLKAGVVVRTISSGTSIGSEGKGSFPWTIPNDLMVNSNYQVRISHATISGCKATSNGSFSIIKAAVASSAGPDQKVAGAEQVRLSAANSTGFDKSKVSYFWTQLDGPQTRLISPTAVEPLFTAPDARTDGESLLFRLIVTGEDGSQSQDSCIVNVILANIPPTADAGSSQTVVGDELVMLDGSGSFDPDDGIATYSWKQLAGPEVTLSDLTIEQPTFAAPEVGPDGEVLVFQLTVTDEGGLRAKDTCIVNVASTNHPPKADAGADLVIQPGTVVTLDGSGSFDPDGNIVSYRWTQLTGQPVTLSDPIAVKPTFVAPTIKSAYEELVFQLTVTDSGGLQDKKKVVIMLDGVTQEVLQ